jgi:GTP-binding protein Era
MENKFGFVSLTGRTNVGKSTLLNSFFQKKIAITSRKPQTTRNRILGILTEKNSQIVFLDTPGVHLGYKRQLNKVMNKIASHCYEEVDLVLFLIDRLKWQKEEENILKSLKNLNKPVVLVVNKVDRLKDKTKLLAFIKDISEKFNFSSIIPISALKKDNLMELKKVILNNLENGPFHFPEDSSTEFSDNFYISEIIREKAINRLGDELPYRLNVVIEKINDSKKLKTIYAAIITESQSQKGIILGKQGSMIKAIGTAARKELEREFSQKVNLQLWVKANKNWTNDINKLKKFGLGVDF